MFKTIIESYGQNMTILSMMSYWVLENAPTIGPNQEVTIREPFPSTLVSKIADEYDIKFAILAMYINKYVPIHIHNQIDEEISPAFYQYYTSHKDPTADAVHLYFPMALGVDTTEHRINLTKQLNKYQITELMTYFAHEFRHIMQRKEFGEYFDHLTQEHHKADDKRDYYNHSHLEIDASMHHIALSVIEDENFMMDVHDYVNEVMRRLTSYKKLTPKQYKHYRRKAAAIFAYFQQKGQSSIKGKTKKELIDKQTQLQRERLRDVIIPFINNNWKYIRDLRKYGMEKPAFWKRKSYLLHKNFPMVIEKMFTKPKEEVSKDTEVFVIFFALLNKAARLNGYSLPIKNIYRLYGLRPMTLKEAMRNPKARQIFGYYDSVFLSNALSELPRMQKDPQE